MRDSGIGEVTLGLVVGHPRVLTTFGLGLFGSRLRLGFERRHGFPYLLQPTLSKGQLLRQLISHACLCRTADLPHHPLPGPVATTPLPPPPTLRCLLLHPLVTHRLMLRCVGLDLRAVQRHVPQLHPAPPGWHNASTCTNRPDSASRLSLRKSEMVRKSGVLFAANTLKAMSSWRRWAMRREDATPTQ